MKLQQFRYLVALADQGTMVRASKFLNVSQPVLSRALKELQAELEVNLLRRSGRGVALTDAGAVAVEAMRRALSAFDMVKPTLEQMYSPPVLRVAATHSMLTLFIEQLSAFMKQRAKVHVEVIAALGTEGVADLLLSGHADLGFCPIDQSPQTLVRRPFRKIEMVLVSPPGTNLPDPVEPKRLKRMPMLNLSTPGEGLEMFNDLFREAGVSPDVVFRSEDTSVFLAAVQSGIGSMLSWRMNTENIPGIEVRSFSPQRLMQIGFLHLPGATQKIDKFFRLLDVVTRPDGSVKSLKNFGIS